MSQRFTFGPMDEADARAIVAWRYEEPYAVYNMGADFDDDNNALEDLLDRRSPYYAVRDERGELAGFFSFGTSALVWDSGEPGIYSEDRTIAIGLGMRPDLTGKGLGVAFVEDGLAFAREQFAPGAFQLFVMPFNERAIKVYEKLGFQRVGMYMQKSELYGERAFVEMRREG